MKKITLLFCFSMVGFMGIAQQSKKAVELKFEKGNSIEIISNEFKSANTLAIASNVKEDLNLELSTHELVHDNRNAVATKDNFIGDNFTYNDYAVNFDFKPIQLIVRKH